MKRLLQIVYFILGTSTLALSQTISGNVSDAKDQSVLIGASVLVKNTLKGVVTDFDGNFEVDGNLGDTLVVSYIGYSSYELVVSQLNNNMITLEPSAQSLDEILITAYGSSTKGSYTGSVAQIKSDKIALRPLTNAIGALEGLAPGVLNNATSGQPGSGPDIRVRGFGSVNASSSPLYVVDGVPFDGNISNINADDIESISVLKDASSAALYGARAANGVIIINTKRGSGRTGKLSFHVSQGFSNRAIPEYDRVGPDDYYVLMWEAYRNSMAYSDDIPLEEANRIASGQVDGENGIGDLLVYNPFNVSADQLVTTSGEFNPQANLLYADDLDWGKELERTGQRQNYSLSYFGGNDESDYYVSLGYLNEKGYLIRSDYERFNGRINVNSQPLTWLKTGINLSGSLTKSDQGSTTGSSSFVNPFFFARNMGPIYPVYAHDVNTGELLYDENGEKIYDLGNLTSLGLSNRPSGASPGRHVIAETRLNQDGFSQNVLGGRGYLTFDFLQNFSFTANVSADLNSYFNFDYDNTLVGDGAPAGRASKSTINRKSFNFNQLLTYKKSFDIHSIDVLLGHENYNFTRDYLYGFKQGLIVDNNTELINFTTINSLTSYQRTYKTEGYLSRLEYSLLSRYFFSASYRRDGTSKFYEDSRWGDFWSVGGAWRLDEEKFMDGLGFLNMLKFRASYGETGNDGVLDADGNTVYYAWQALYDLGFNNALEPGFLQASLSNTSLVWESNNSLDLGFDFVMFDDRLSGSLEYFYRVSDNLLFSVPLPVSSGINTQDQNVGTMSNAGIEVQLNGRLIDKNDFSLDLGINITTIKNNITKLPQEEIITGTKKLSVGHSIYDYWLRQWSGVDPSDGSALFFPEEIMDDDGNELDDIRTINGIQYTIDQNNAKYDYSGTAIPDVYGSFNAGFRYKNFQLSSLFSFQLGGKVYDGLYGSLMSSGDYGNAIHVDILNRWQNPGDVTDVPRMDANKLATFGAASSRWLEDASYLNLRSLSLSYNLPKSILERIGGQSIVVYLSGENLAFLSKRKGMNLVQNFNGTTSNVYAPARNISLGLKINM
ncbi:SusC/RagA family TonB-linked outer membrane protein [Membranihabitans marinus]|uniref:SusC/RagA family TonB-linked outer membrane protein n=1 Tax=Membranihabitans marinus TaxID=1227546 RepID=UPI001F023C90|nr:SusC/RagA family TonB-linked outer membrane protein [Membranihabitans marinus]